jgi:hypothetical protein
LTDLPPLAANDDAPRPGCCARGLRQQEKPGVLPVVVFANSGSGVHKGGGERLWFFGKGFSHVHPADSFPKQPERMPPKPPCSIESSMILWNTTKD